MEKPTATPLRLFMTMFFSVVFAAAAGQAGTGLCNTHTDRGGSDVILSTPSLPASSLPGDSCDVLDYTITLTLTPDSVFVHGNVRMEFLAGQNGVSTIAFHLVPELAIDSITAPVSVEDVSREGEVVTVSLGSPIAPGDSSWIRTFYRGVPPEEELGSFHIGEHNGHPVIYTLSWPDDARTWWPCRDELADKATATLSVTVPEGLTVASNGLLVEEIDNGDGTTTFHWREDYPITTYTVGVTISNYEEFSDYWAYAPGESLFLAFYAYPEHLDMAQEDWSVTAEMVAFYDSIFGRYPFIREKYGMAEIPVDLYSAMGHQTLTFYGSLFVTGLHLHDLLTAHELVHSWWGNCITPQSWEESWIDEGFSGFGEALWVEHVEGVPAYIEYMDYLDTHDFSGTLFGNPDLYSAIYRNKGAWVYHMLRGIMGDLTFFDILPDVSADLEFRYGSSTTERLQMLLESMSGIDLHAFFDQWVYGEGRPDYYLVWEATETGGTWEVTVVIEQVQPGGELFTMPLELLFASGSQSVTETITDSVLLFQEMFELPWEPDTVCLDPDRWVLKDLTPALSLVSDSLKRGTVGVPYGDIIRIRGGVEETTVSIAEGELPDGLTLNPENGVILGVPTTVDSCTFLARATDSWTPPHTDERWYTIVIQEGTGIEKAEEASLPRQYELLQNYPNPFNPLTTIVFSVPETGDREKLPVSLEIYDARGRSVKTLVKDFHAPGRYRIVWDGSTDRGEPAGSGVYFSVLKAGGETIRRKLLLTR